MRRLALLVVLGLGLAGAAQAHHMVAAANPLAVQAGLQVLRDGGSAADAAIAVQMVLALVEPQASGLGGGAMAVTSIEATHEVLAWDGRETAPAAAGPNLFLGRDGKPMPRLDAALGGRAVGVPGTVRMLEALHHAQGKLPWDRLVAPAIALAEKGFPVSPALSAAIARDAANLRRQPAARAYFFLADGSPLPAGIILVNRPLADTLRGIAASGADALLHGPIASDIATTVRSDPSPGLITTDDLAAIATRPRPALCGAYRSFRVCGIGPPGGGVSVLQIMGMLGHFNVGGFERDGADLAQLLLEAEKLAAADRALYLADVDFLPVPVRGLLDPGYLADRARPIALGHANPAPIAGTPDFGDVGVGRKDTEDKAMAPALPQPEHGTSQICVVDDAGNAVSLTSTIQDPFGSRLLVHGFLLNDELTDFAFVPDIDGRDVANRVEGGKRPASAMSPTLVFAAEGSLRLVAGSEGGARIIGFVAQSLVRMLDFGMTPLQALSAGHIEALGGVAELEAGTSAADLAQALQSRGQVVSVLPIDSGQQAILVTPAGLIGGADPRREGVAAGD